MVTKMKIIYIYIFAYGGLVRWNMEFYWEGFSGKFSYQQVISV